VSEPFSAFIAYADVPAARRAMTHVKTLLQAASADRTLQPMLWRCDQLDEVRWREMARVDAAQADVIVVSLSENTPLCAPAEAWLTSLAAGFHGTSVRVLALLGDEAWTIGLQQTVPVESTESAANATAEADSNSTLVALAEKIGAARAA
jgi:hypothetical protein